MGVLAGSGRLGAILAQFVNGSLEGNVPLLLMVTCGCMVIGGLVSWLLPDDHSGTRLEDQMEIKTIRVDATDDATTSSAHIDGTAVAVAGAMNPINISHLSSPPARNEECQVDGRIIADGDASRYSNNHNGRYFDRQEVYTQAASQEVEGFQMVPLGGRGSVDRNYVRVSTSVSATAISDIDAV
jgi:hypothetical protein